MHTALWFEGRQVETTHCWGILKQAKAHSPWATYAAVITQITRRSVAGGGNLCSSHLMRRREIDGGSGGGGWCVVCGGGAAHVRLTAPEDVGSETQPGSYSCLIQNNTITRYHSPQLLPTDWKKCWWTTIKEDQNKGLGRAVAHGLSI